MVELSVVIFERICIVLITAFMLTRIPSFRSLIEREKTGGTIFLHSFLFGAFAIIGTELDFLLPIDLGVGNQTGLIPNFLDGYDGSFLLLTSSIVILVIAGLLGGPTVGLGAGLLTASFLIIRTHHNTIPANLLITPLSGLLSGFTARFFAKERIISPLKALFIGMFAPILYMALVLIFPHESNHAITLVNQVGLPMVLADSIAIAVFTTVIQLVLNETEKEVASETKRALQIVELALPHLHKGIHGDTAEALARLLYQQIKVIAVSITDTKQVLAHVGKGREHHTQGNVLQLDLSHIAKRKDNVYIEYERDQICLDPTCPLHAAIVVPLYQSGAIVGSIQLFFRRVQQIRSVDIALAQGLGKLLSNHLDAIAVDNLKKLVQDAELRNLQAQINPHFLFNTLNIISSLVRVDPNKARHIIAQLGHFMRFNIKLTSSKLVTLAEELEHLNAYLDIVKTRFADQLEIQYRVDQAVGAAMIPPATLQPLIENSIKHGLGNTASGGKIEIELKLKAGLERSTVNVRILDNGKGFPPELLDQLGQKPITDRRDGGMGLYIVNQRLISTMGQEAGLSFHNLTNSGSSIEFSLPYINRESNEGGFAC